MTHCVDIFNVVIVSDIYDVIIQPNNQFLSVYSFFFVDSLLHVACMDNAEDACEFLISAGAKLNVQNAKGETPL